MTSWTHLAFDWLTVSADDNPSINVYEMRFSRGEINDYYSIYTMTTSPYLYITTIYSYWRFDYSRHVTHIHHISITFFIYYNSCREHESGAICERCDPRECQCRVYHLRSLLLQVECTTFTSLDGDVARLISEPCSTPNEAVTKEQCAQPVANRSSDMDIAKLQ